MKNKSENELHYYPCVHRRSAVAAARSNNSSSGGNWEATIAAVAAIALAEVAGAMSARNFFQIHIKWFKN